MNKNIKKITWYELIEAMDYNQELPISEQVEEHLNSLGYKTIEIDNIIFNVDNLINKLSKVELTYIKRGEAEALKRWHELGLPKLEG